MATGGTAQGGWGGSALAENTNTLCSDGIDNDNNGHTDCDDWSCCKYGVPSTGISVCKAGTCGGGITESTDGFCSDGMDNDANGYADCSDYNCCKNGVPGAGISVCAWGTCYGPGNPGGGTGGSGGATCDPDTAASSEACSTCMQNVQSSACAESSDDCSSNADCQFVLNCIGNCYDNACYQTCFEANPPGTRLFLSFYGCLQARCHDPCYCPGCSLSTSMPQCDACLEGGCLTACNGCDMFPACMGYLLCYSYLCTSGDPSCVQACADSNPGGEAAMGTLETCIGTTCGSECVK